MVFFLRPIHLAASTYSLLVYGSSNLVGSPVVQHLKCLLFCSRYRRARLTSVKKNGPYITVFLAKFVLWYFSWWACNSISWCSSRFLFFHVVSLSSRHARFVKCDNSSTFSRLIVIDIDCVYILTMTIIFVFLCLYQGPIRVMILPPILTPSSRASRNIHSSSFFVTTWLKPDWFEPRCGFGMVCLQFIPNCVPVQIFNLNYLLPFNSYVCHYLKNDQKIPFWY